MKTENVNIKSCFGKVQTFISDANNTNTAIVTSGALYVYMIGGGSSPLPAGAATSALQTAGNATLTTINGKITACDTTNLATASNISALGTKIDSTNSILGAATWFTSTAICASITSTNTLLTSTNSILGLNLIAVNTSNSILATLATESTANDTFIECQDINTKLASTNTILSGTLLFTSSTICGKIDSTNSILASLPGFTSSAIVGAIGSTNSILTSTNAILNNMVTQIDNALSVSAYDLQANSYSATSVLSNDYILDNITFLFTTAESKTISITDAGGTVYWTDTTSATSVLVEEIDVAFDGTMNFKVIVTQTTNPCAMTMLARVKQGSTMLYGSTVLSGGTATIGSVGLKAVDVTTGTTLYNLPAYTDERILGTMNKSYEICIAEGEIVGHTPWSKIGYNSDVDTGAAGEDMIPWGGTATWPTSTGLRMQVSSSSISDSSTGIGIRAIRIFYLDPTGAEMTEDVTLNGTVAVTTSAINIWRINNVRAISTGTTLAAVGNIRISDSSTGTIQYGGIMAGFNRARSIQYTVPLGKRLYIDRVIGSVGGSAAGKDGYFTTLATYESKLGYIVPWFTAYTEFGLVDNILDMPLRIPTGFPELTDIKVRFIATTDNCMCHVALKGWLEDA